MKPTKKQRRRTLLVIIAIILYIWFLIHHAGPFSTYIPLTGRIFDVSTENVEEVWFTVNDLGKMVKYSGEELEPILDAINDMRYIAWCPYLINGLAGNNGNYSFTVVGYREYGSPREGLNVRVWGNQVVINGVCYFLRSDMSRLDAFDPAH